MIAPAINRVVNKIQRRKAGALAASASLVTTIAALSDAIAFALGISQRKLLAGDIALAGALLILILAVSRGRPMFGYWRY